MKKIMLALMLVVLTLCLFVGCSSSPKKQEETKIDGYFTKVDDKAYVVVADNNGEWYLVYEAYPGLGYIESNTGSGKVLSFRSGDVTFNLDKKELVVNSQTYTKLDAIQLKELNTGTHTGNLLITFEVNGESYTIIHD